MDKIEQQLSNYHELNRGTKLDLIEQLLKDGDGYREIAQKITDFSGIEISFQGVNDLYYRHRGSFHKEDQPDNLEELNPSDQVAQVIKQSDGGVTSNEVHSQLEHLPLTSVRREITTLFESGVLDRVKIKAPDGPPWWFYRYSWRGSS